MAKNQFVLLKLTSGEEVIARDISSDGESKVSLSKVRALVMVPTGPNQMGTRLLPWVAGAADATVSIERHHIITMVSETDISKDLINGYIQQTTSIDLSTTSPNGLLKA